MLPETRSALQAGPEDRIVARARRIWLERQVKAMYDLDMAEPVPDRILALVEQLSARPGMGESGKTA